MKTGKVTTCILLSLTLVSSGLPTAFAAIGIVKMWSSSSSSIPDYCRKQVIRQSVFKIEKL